MASLQVVCCAGIFLALVGEAARLPEPSFYAAFDGKTENALEAKGVSFVPGVKGQAVKLSRAARSSLVYPSSNYFSRTEGTISFFCKPEWSADQAKSWHWLFSVAPLPFNDRKGAGGIFIWVWEDNFRADPSLKRDGCIYKGRPALGAWQHIAYSWDNKLQRLFVNGVKVREDYHVPDFDKAVTWDRFCLGANREWGQSDVSFDELRIFREALTDRQVASLFMPLQFDNIPAFAGNRAGGSFTAVINNYGTENLPTTWQCAKEGGTVEIAADCAVTVTVSQASLSSGRNEFTARTPAYSYPQSQAIWKLKSENPWIASAQSNLDLTLLETVKLDKPLPPDRFVATAPYRVGTLNGVPYLEAGTNRGDRFGIRFRLPGNGPLYCFDFDYPDDKVRTCDISVQHSIESKQEDGASYSLQVGYATGDEFRIPNVFHTKRCLYWANSNDVTVVFTSFKEGKQRDHFGPAACSEIRLYRVNGGLPEAIPASAFPAGKKSDEFRTLGLYFEDVAIGYDFAVSPLMPEFEEEMNRCIAYMKYTGQNLFTYPCVWYQGLIGPEYMPRTHENKFMEGWLSKLDGTGIGFMPSYNVMDIPAAKDALKAEACTNGTLYSSFFTARDSGKVGGTGVPGSRPQRPTCNILHPETQAAMLRHLDKILSQGLPHESFKGVDFRLSDHCTLWFYNIHSGYNDYMIDGFTADTGIHVPVDRTDPLRGKAYAVWLLANAREQWVSWRCKKVAEFYRLFAARLAAARPDLRLCLNVPVPFWNVFEPSWNIGFQGDSDYDEKHFGIRLMREAGVDFSLLADVPNIICCQGGRPMLRRGGYMQSFSNSEKETAFLRNVYFLQGYHESLDGARSPWVHAHDHYFESAYGRLQNRNGTPTQWAHMNNDWFTEHAWHVATVTPPGFYAMRQYAAPMRWHDILGMTRGGFLIGTYGLEDLLIPFAKAFRALPAKIFRDEPGSTETVKYRSLEQDGMRWFYVVNTDDRPADFSVSLSSTAPVVDLITGKRAREQQGTSLALRLAPYQLRSFRIGQ